MVGMSNVGGGGATTKMCGCESPQAIIVNGPKLLNLKPQNFILAVLDIRSLISRWWQGLVFCEASGEKSFVSFFVLASYGSSKSYILWLVTRSL